MTTSTQPAAESKSPDAQITRKPRSLWSDARRRFRKSTIGMVGLCICLFLIAVAIIVPLTIPYESAIARDSANKLLPPSWLMAEAERADLGWDTWDRPFGTDKIGRNLFLQVLHGAPISLTVGFFAVMLAVVFGSFLGLMAGFFGGLVDTILTWIMDIMLAFPSILLAIALTAISNERGSIPYKIGEVLSGLPVLRSIIDLPLANAMLAVSVVEIPIFGRIARAAVLSVRNQEYITAATAVGVNKRRIMLRHILPNSLTPIIVQMTLSIATAITSVAALGFLGLGPRPPRPEWGSLLADARNYIGTGQWWYALFPGLAIMLTVLGFNLFGDGLRDALDPKTRD